MGAAVLPKSRDQAGRSQDKVSVRVCTSVHVLVVIVMVFDDATVEEKLHCVFASSIVKTLRRFAFSL